MPHGPEVILVLKGSYNPLGSMGPIEPHEAQRAPYAPYELRGRKPRGSYKSLGPHNLVPWADVPYGIQVAQRPVLT